jgi:hypothetical protein
VKNEDSPRIQLAEAIATVHEFVVHASALAGMGIKLPVPCELGSLAREIIEMLSRMPQDAEPSTGVPRDGVSTEYRSDTTIASGATTSSQRPSVGEPTVRRKTMRDAILDVIEGGEVMSVHQVTQRLHEAGFSANPNTVSNELSRWARLGELDRPRRGHYWRAQAPRDEEAQPPTANHSPTAQQKWREGPGLDFGTRKENAYGEGQPAQELEV